MDTNNLPSDDQTLKYKLFLAGKPPLPKSLKSQKIPDSVFQQQHQQPQPQNTSKALSSMQDKYKQVWESTIQDH